jgi:hypothetical protein
MNEINKLRNRLKNASKNAIEYKMSINEANALSLEIANLEIKAQEKIVPAVEVRPSIAPMYHTRIVDGGTF